MKGLSLKRLLLGSCACLGLFAGVSSANETSELVIVTWGGTLAEQMNETFFTPFGNDNSVNVRLDTGPEIERSRAEVESGSPSYDMTATNLAFYLIGEGQNLWEPMDYDVFDQDVLARIPQNMRKSHGIAAYVYAHGMSFNTDAYPEGGPQPGSWADFWDVERFPGQRAMADCGSASRPVPEAALLADGVPMDELYPIDIERAARKLREIAPHVVWWTNANQPGQLLASGEVTMAMAPTNRIQTLLDQGAPVEIVWNQSQWTFDAWYVLRGAPNAANAMKFIASAMSAERQAEFARASSMAPTNPDAFALIDDETARKLPTYPENFEPMYEKNEAWWEENRAAWAEACLAAIIE